MLFPTVILFVSSYLEIFIGIFYFLSPYKHLHIVLMRSSGMYLSNIHFCLGKYFLTYLYPFVFIH